jgi:hypothetical protein
VTDIVRNGRAQLPIFQRIDNLQAYYHHDVV